MHRKTRHVLLQSSLAQLLSSCPALPRPTPRSVLAATRLRLQFSVSICASCICLRHVVVVLVLSLLLPLLPLLLLLLSLLLSAICCLWSYCSCPCLLVALNSRPIPSTQSFDKRTKVKTHFAFGHVGCFAYPALAPILPLPFPALSLLCVEGGQQLLVRLS